MLVGLYARRIVRFPKEALLLLFSLMEAHQMRLSIFKDLEEQLPSDISALITRKEPSFHSYATLNEHMEVMISMGGDGTFLEAARIIRDKRIPIIGINFGRLGFLADANKQNMNDIIAALARKHYFVDKRILLHIGHNNSTTTLFNNTHFALNDCTVKSIAMGSMLQINAFLNGALLCSYWADGVIIATPTGSTGYSLSCGGPIVFPDTPCFIITPIAPHNLNVRPIVVPSAKSIISLQVEAREKKFICSLDTRHYELSSQIQLAIQQETYQTYVIKLNEKSFLDTIKQKLLWGEDPRGVQLPKKNN